MAQVTVYAQSAGMNWDASNGWNTAAGGGGTSYTNPQNGADTFICDLNALQVVLNVDVTVDRIQSSNLNGYLTVTTTRSITGSDGTANVIQHSSGGQTGMVRVSAGTLTISTGIVANTSSGWAVVLSGTGDLVISNAGNTAVLQSGSGRGVTTAVASRLITITGNIVQSSTGWGVTANANTCTVTITGNVSCSGNAARGVNITNSSACTITGDLSATQGAAVYMSNTATLAITGNLSSESTTTALAHAIDCITSFSGTVTWTGASTLAANTQCTINIPDGTLALADATGALTLTCNGRLAIIMTSSATLVTTAAGGTAAINVAASNACAAIIGFETNIIALAGAGTVNFVGSMAPNIISRWGAVPYRV